VEDRLPSQARSLTAERWSSSIVSKRLSARTMRRRNTKLSFRLAAETHRLAAWAPQSAESTVDLIDDL